MLRRSRQSLRVYLTRTPADGNQHGHDENKAISFHGQNSGRNTPAIFADLSGDSTPGFDFTPIQQFNISLSGFHVFEDLDTRLPIYTGTPLLVSKPEFLYSVRDEIEIGQGNIAELGPNELSYRPFSATSPGPLWTRYHRTCLVDCSYLNAIGPTLSPL